MKRNIYLTLTVLCVFSVILLQSMASAPEYPSNMQPPLDKANLAQIPSNPLLAITGLLYLFLFFIGVINLSKFIWRKIKNRPVAEFGKNNKILPLSEEQSSRLIFLITFLVFSIYILSLALNLFFASSLNVDLLTVLNMLTQILAICLVLKYIPYSFFGFRLEKKELIFLLKVYTAIIPLTLAGLILNKIITDKIGLQYLPNPALELFFSLDNKFSLYLLVLEIVVLAPLAEELFFRGFLYKLIRQRYGFLTSAVFVSVLFSFIHRTPQGIISLFILSICLSYVYEKIQDISAPVVFHSIHNLINLLLLLIVKNLL